VHDFAWSEQPWIKGSFGSTPLGGGCMVKEWSTPEDRIHFAGDFTTLKTGWVEGAIESSLRAARQIDPEAKPEGRPLIRQELYGKPFSGGTKSSALGRPSKGFRWYSAGSEPGRSLVSVPSHDIGFLCSVSGQISSATPRASLDAPPQSDIRNAFKPRYFPARHDTPGVIEWRSVLHRACAGPSTVTWKRRIEQD